MFLHRLPIFFVRPNNNIILAVAGGTNGTPLTLNAVLDTFNYATGIASFSFTVTHTAIKAGVFTKQVTVLILKEAFAQKSGKHYR